MKLKGKSLSIGGRLTATSITVLGLGLALNGPDSRAQTAAGQSETTSSGVLNQIKSRYEALFFGPELTQRGFQEGVQAANNGESDMFVSHRPRISTKIGDQSEAGFQLRLATLFSNDGLQARAQDSRLFFNTGTFAAFGLVKVSATPRVVLPFSNAAHNGRMLPSPELLVSFDVSPENSRFSFSYTPQLIKYLYHGSGSESGDLELILVNNIEANYQATPFLVIEAGYYPEWDAARSWSGLLESSNQVQLGLNFTLSPTVRLTPSLATELNGMSRIGFAKNSQLNVALRIDLL